MCLAFIAFVRICLRADLCDKVIIFHIDSSAPNACLLTYETEIVHFPPKHGHYIVYL